MPLLLLASVLLQAASPPDYYVHVCEARATLPDGGLLTGSIAVTDDGALESFFAQATPAETALDHAFFTRHLDGIRADSNVRWSMAWRDGGGLVHPADIAFEAGEWELTIQGRRNLPASLAVALGVGHDPAALTSFGTRWPGLRSGAGFRFRIGPMLGFAGAGQGLRWRLHRAPVSGLGDAAPAVLSGEVDLTRVRAVAPAFAAFKRDLLAKVADAPASCRREGVTIPPGADI